MVQIYFGSILLVYFTLVREFTSIHYIYIMHVMAEAATQKLKNINCSMKNINWIKKSLKLYDPFLWMGFNCFNATEPLPGDSLLFIRVIKFSRIEL